MTVRANQAIHICWLTIFLVLITLHASSIFAAKKLPRAAPEFTHTERGAWLNSTPLSLEQLRGKVVLFDFWTFDCWNCYRSFPWLHALEDQFKNQAFSVIGIHTPEFEHERHKGMLEEKIKLFRLRHPIMMDNDFSYWNAVGSRYWPSFYLIDKKGLIRASYIGQTDEGGTQAKKIEAMVDTLLAE